jgi:hypothetical protein
VLISCVVTYLSEIVMDVWKFYTVGTESLISRCVILHWVYPLLVAATGMFSGGKPEGVTILETLEMVGG